MNDYNVLYHPQLIAVTYFAKQAAGKPVFVNFLFTDANLLHETSIQRYEKASRSTIDIKIPEAVTKYRHAHNFVDIVKSETSRVRNLHRAKKRHIAKLHAAIYNMLHNMHITLKMLWPKSRSNSFRLFIEKIIITLAPLEPLPKPSTSNVLHIHEFKLRKDSDHHGTCQVCAKKHIRKVCSICQVQGKPVYLCSWLCSITYHNPGTRVNIDQQ